MSLLISIHDVTPALEKPVRELWQLCASCNVVPALLVVPNWHGQWPLERHPAFVEWIAGCANSGAEIFLHGERHDEVGLPRSLTDSVRAFGRTAREGEFLTLQSGAARDRIARGIELFRTLNLQPIGFIAPAWLAHESTYDVVANMGLALSEDVSTVHVHARNARVVAPVLRWSGRTALRALGSDVVAAFRWATRNQHQYARIALHPQDLLNARTARSVKREMVRWTQAQTAARYADLLVSTVGRAYG